MLYLLASLVTALAMVMYVPQAVRLLRTRNAAGVSRLGLVNTWVSSTGWSVYLAHLSDWPMLAATVAPLVPLGISLWFARRNESRLLPAAVWALVLVLAGLAGWAVLGVVLSFSIVLFYGPAALAAWRALDRSGISVFSWSLACGEAVLSVAYGLLGGNLAVAAYGGLAALGAAAVLAACVGRRAVPVEIPAQRRTPSVDPVPSRVDVPVHAV